MPRKAADSLREHLRSERPLASGYALGVQCRQPPRPSGRPRCEQHVRVKRNPAEDRERFLASCSRCFRGSRLPALYIRSCAAVFPAVRLDRAWMTQCERALSARSGKDPSETPASSADSNSRPPMIASSRRTHSPEDYRPPTGKGSGGSISSASRSSRSLIRPNNSRSHADGARTRDHRWCDQLGQRHARNPRLREARVAPQDIGKRSGATSAR